MSAVVRATLLVAVWLALTDGRLGDLPVGILAAGSATWVSLRLLPPASSPASPVALLVLAARYLRAALTAGIDVARRALDPRLPIRPGIVVYRTTLPPGATRDAFRALMCLQPGALPVESAEQDGVLIHCLDTGLPVAQAFAREESRFATALGLKAPHG